MLDKIKTLNEFLAKPLPVFKSAISLVAVPSLLAAFLLNAGCVPKEAKNVASAAVEPSISYSGFAGLTSAQTMSSSKVKLTWTPSTDPSVKAYNIYDTSLLLSPKLIKTILVTAGATPVGEVTILNLLPQNLYSFRVRAINTGNIEDTNKVDLNAIPYGGASSVTVDSAIAATISFPDASNADAARIYCQLGTVTDWILLATVNNPASPVSPAITTSKQIGGSSNPLNAGVQYTCRVALSINGYEDNNTSTVVFTPVGVATQILFTTQPGSAPASQIFSQQPVITIKDVNGTVVSAGADSTAAVTLTISSVSPSTGTVLGTATVSAVRGVATFVGLKIAESGVKILTATKADTSSQATGSQALTVDSNQFTISSGNVSATRSSIAITPVPTAGTALVANGINAYTVIIKLLDDNGNPVAGVRPTFASNISGDSLTQPSAATDATGTTTGSISTTIADTTPARKLNISSPSALVNLTVLAPFVPGPASKLAFTVQPTNAPSGPNGLAVISVAVQDAQGNTVTTGNASTSQISMAIAANTNAAVLTGTTPVTAVAGVATFQDLGISKTQTGYKLLATSGSYSPAYSNSFNVTAGVPSKIVITSAVTQTPSGSCSAAINVQLQDSGSNPANAIQNTPITISGLGTGALYTSSSCSTAVSSSLTFAAGTASKTLYFKDAKAEAVTMTGTDPSGVLTTGTLGLQSAPDKMALLAQAAPPAANGTMLSVPAGRCSSAITITPLGDNGVAGPIFTTQSVSITMTGGNPDGSSSATLFADSGCTTPVTASNIMLVANLGPVYATSLYLKDPLSETVSLSLVDPSGKLATTSSLQTVQVGAASLDFAGPATVVSGACSTAYTIRMLDGTGAAVKPSANTALTINGLASSTSGVFYTSPSCTGTAATSSVTFPANAVQMQIFFKDQKSETLHVSISDPASLLTISQTVDIQVSPSALSMTGPVAGTAKTTVCSGPFTIATLDGSGTSTAAITPINVTLSGAGAGGAFFGTSTCPSGGELTGFTFNAGQSSKVFYYQGGYPSSGLTLTVADNANVLTSGTFGWNVTAAAAFLGSAGSLNDASGNAYWFQHNPSIVAGRMDGQRGGRVVHFDSSTSTRPYLYVADPNMGRVFKFDYIAQKYIGWIGAFSSYGNVGVTGSNLSVPSTASCAGTTNGNPVPGWCTGGQSYNDGTVTTGKMNYPAAIANDANYVYVANRAGYTVNRYNATTGAFAGYIGQTSSAPTGTGPGNPTSCTGSYTSGTQATSGWCIGGSNQSAPTPTNAGWVNYPQALTVDGTYLYVGSYGAVGRYRLSDGGFAGWIGRISGTTGLTGACAGQASNAVTAGWCMGGTYANANMRSVPGAIQDPSSVFIIGASLYVMNWDSNITVTVYNLSTGAYQSQILPSGDFHTAYGAAPSADGSLIYVADSSRLVKIDLTGTTQGWIGKISNNTSMNGACASTSPAINSNTPGWCGGGTSKNGMEEGAFHQLTSVDVDQNGNLVTGQGDNFPAVKLINGSSGVIQGTLAQISTSPTKWSNDLNAVAGYYGFDDNSFYTPAGTFVGPNGNYLYIAEYDSGRVKKINLKTGQTVGWIGAITTVPTGGVYPATCLSATPNAGSTGWCLGSFFQPSYMDQTFISYNSDGVFNRPGGITGDGTYLYVTDINSSRILRFNQDTGAFAGWIGQIGTKPTGGDTACTATSVAVGQFTPGWCKGGAPAAGSGDGALNAPAGITYVSGVIYVVDTNNHRISSYNTTSGAFNGWIGKIYSGTPTGCSSFSNGQDNYSGGWCKGGTSNYGPQGNDRGGTFNFNQNYSQTPGIATDGTYLYIPNFWNVRVDKWSLAGYFLGAAPTKTNVFTNVWVMLSTPTNPSSTDSARTTLQNFATGNDYPLQLTVDANNIYGTTNWFANGGNSVVWKMNKTTGTMVGWQGGISFTQSPTAGDSGCAGATGTTPGWCQGGSNNVGFRLGYFTNSTNGLAGDANFLYITDANQNRVTRIPK